MSNDVCSFGRYIGPLSSATAASLRSALSAAQSSLKLPHPLPPPSVSLASALFAPTSPLFSSSPSPDPKSELNQTNPADPSAVSSSTPSDSSGAHKDLAMSIARTLEVPLGLKLEKASLRWAGWETTTSFAGSDAAPEGGYESLIGKVINQAVSKGAEVKLNVEIQKIQLENDSVTVTDGNGKSFTSKTVICTIPLGVLKTLPATTFVPPLPGQMQEAIKGTHVGVLEKIVLKYPTAWWPEAESTGSYTFLPTSTAPLNEQSPVREILDASTLSCANFACPSLPGPSPTLLTYLSETPAVGLLKHDPADVARGYHEFLVDRLKPASSPPEPIDSYMTTWLTDPLSRGATTTPSIISEKGERSPMDFKELGRPVWGGRLGFAGEHTEMEHRGSVAGAVVSGFREAERVERLLNM